MITLVLKIHRFNSASRCQQRTSCCFAVSTGCVIPDCSSKERFFSYLALHYCPVSCKQVIQSLISISVFSSHGVMCLQYLYIQEPLYIFDGNSAQQGRGKLTTSSPRKKGDSRISAYSAVRLPKRNMKPNRLAVDPVLTTRTRTTSIGAQCS